MRKFFITILMALSAAILFPSCNGNVDLQTRLNITSGQQLVVLADDSLAVFDFEIINVPAEAMMEVEVPEDAGWIVRNEITMFEVSGKVKLAITKNDDMENRSALITLKYRYGDNELTQRINIIQLTRAFDYVFEAKATKCNYWGRDAAFNGHDFYSYEIILGNPDVTVLTADGHYYSIDFMLDHKNDNWLLSPGVYTMCEKGEEASFGIGKVYTRYLHMDEEGMDYDINVTFVDGKITVEEADGIYTISGYLVDINYDNHQLYYQGPLVGINRLIESTLTDNVEIDLEEGYQIQAKYFGDIFEKGNHAWILNIGMEGYPENTPIVQIQLCTSMDVTPETGFQTQEFTFDEFATCETNTFIKGFSNYEGGEEVKRYEGSWYYTSAGLVDNLLYITTPDAPIRGGSVSFVRNEDGTLDVDIDVVDDGEHTIKASGKGIPAAYADMTVAAEASKASAPSVRAASVFDRK